MQLFLIFIPKNLDKKQFTIKEGDTAYEIATDLKKDSLIRSSKWFYLIVRLNKYDRKLTHGTYEFTGKYNLPQVIRKLVFGEVYSHKLTIPEGSTLFKTIRLMSEKGIASIDTLEKISADTAFIRITTGFKAKSLDGFLYPATYDILPEMTARDMFKQMIEEFFERTENLDKSNKTKFYQTMKLASIVEREYKVESDKPLIASVYRNRLDIGMKLQADPTVSYLIEKDGLHHSVVLYKDLRRSSPYNTYIISGLPPTPICTPTVTSLKAALKPAQTNYLFFFAGPDGKHIFTKDYASHLKMQKQIKKQNKKA